jgi:uncharacterized protein YndB with AHSA1/START domain
MPESQDRVAEPFVLTRNFDAPRALVFAAFTQLEHLQHWMGPKGTTLVDATVDLRPGGVFRYGMQTPDGATMWGQWLFREIVAPERLVVVVQFCDAEGRALRHPMAPTWPLSTLSTTRLEERDGKTLMTLVWQAHDATPIEQQTFDAAHAGMTQGWNGTMDQLAAYLALLQAP